MEKISFVRFGGLSPVAQDQYTAGKNKTFHNPPRRKGLYAFPWPYIERFLLGSTSDPGHVSNKVSWIKDDDGNPITSKSAELPYEEWKAGNFDAEYYPWFNKLLKKRKIKRSLVGTSLYKEVEGDADNIYCMTLLKKPKLFTYTGPIWHHLVDHVKPGFAIDTSGSWVLTDYDIYVEAFNREKHVLLRSLVSDGWFGKNIKNLPRGTDPLKYYAKDHLEVFIDRL